MKTFITAGIAAAALLLTGCGGVSAAGSTGTGSAPQACLDALDHADRSHRITLKVLTATADGWGAASRFDAAGIDAATARVESLTGPFGRTMDNYRAARDECRNR